MALSDLRHRTRLLFVAVMVGHILLISSQVNTRRGVSLLEETLTAVVVEVQRVTWSVVGGVQYVWDSYVALRGVRDRNEWLARENAELRIQIQQQRALAHGAEQLRALLDLRTRFVWRTTAAEVIGGGVSPSFRSISIDKGAQAGVERDMAVIAPTGIVGRIVEPSPRASSVQLLIDQNAAAAVMLERSGSQGVAVGQGDGLLSLEYLSGVADVQHGDLVVTSGLDGVFPKGLAVGRVTTVEKSGPSYRHVVVTPSVDFTSLETVLIVMTRPGPADKDPE